MKNSLLKGLVLFLILTQILSCEKETINPDINGEVINYTDCKSFKSASLTAEIPNSQSCVDWTYDQSSDKLSLKHINAGFNCCPGKLTCKVTQSVDTLFIEEFESQAGCKCNCLYDLDIDVKNIKSGKYRVRFIEPYCGDQEKILFDINLKEKSAGTFCVTRKKYPWGMGS